MPRIKKSTVTTQNTRRFYFKVSKGDHIVDQCVLGSTLTEAWTRLCVLCSDQVTAVEYVRDEAVTVSITVKD